MLKKAAKIAREKGFLYLMSSACKYLYRSALEFLGVPLAIYIIKNRKFTEAEDVLDFVYSFKVLKLNIKPQQVKEEIGELIKILYQYKPRNILEIGTASGGTLFLFCKVAAPDATIISIDLPGGPFGGGYPRWKIPLYKSFVKENQKLFLIRADSHNPKTLETVKEILGDKKLDFLFIDGDHTYIGVKKDFEMYSPLVKPGGIIAFHDIVPHPPETKCEVDRFWNEIKHNYKYFEIIKDRNQGWAGIGILYV